MWEIGLKVLGGCALSVIASVALGICILIVTSFVKAAKDILKK